MKILFSVSHPAHVHLFKNAIWKLQDLNHDILICARKKEVTIDLLKKYGFTYTVISESKPSRVHLVAEQIQRVMRFRSIVSEFKPDLSISTMDPSLAFVSRLMGVPYVCLADTEHASASINGALPFTKAVLTPSCFSKEMGPKQIRYNGYHELAYLPPNRFIPNPAVLTELGLDTDDNIFLVRFAAFDASHDTKTEHFDKRYIPELINRLEDNGTVVISSEVKLEPYLQKYQYKLSPDRYHDLLYFSKMYIGEGSTSAMEAAVLGVPPIHFERLNIGGQKSTILPYIGVLNELQAKYNLLYSFCDERDLLSKVDEILADLNQAKVIWGRRRDALLNDKIDVTAFMVWFIENYPASFNQLKNNPTIGENFKLRLSEVV